MVIYMEGGEGEVEYHTIFTTIFLVMNFIGAFREGEIGGKPFHIFSYLSQTDNPSSSSSSSDGEAAIDSGGQDDIPPLQPLFICQSFHTTNQWYRRREDDSNGEDFVPADVSPYPQFFNKRSGDQQFQFLIGSKVYDHPCKVPLIPLFWCNNRKPNNGEYDNEEFECGACLNLDIGTDYLYCVTCDKQFHKECIESPLELNHPSYPFLSLKLYYPPENLQRKPICFSCKEPVEEMFYYSPTYNLTMHPVCALKPIPIVIDHPKRHPHTLTFFPKQTSLACDVCGQIKELIPTYICARCVFVVHQDCISHPYVIKISRHQHRIYFIYSLPPGNLSCGVCRRKVDNNYGAYSCNKCDGYFVHTKCALRGDLWDGKELEGVPEEPEIVVEPPFKRISDGIILHFSHSHHLKLQISKFYDEHKFCQACVLPIYEGNYYACMDECDFILHEACADAPRKIPHALHAHSLTLEIVIHGYGHAYGFFFCSACNRSSCGFAYANDTDSWYYRLDLRCASVSEPFEYESHEHPLFLALTPEEEEVAICQVCQEEGDEINRCRKLNCIECNFIICFACATLPYKAKYKHDKHLLTFRKKEEASDDHPGWCDICEGKIEYSRKGGFYSCDDYCSTTLHVDCLLGEEPYLKPDRTITRNYSASIDILSNKTMSRPLCHGKEHRCPQKVVFKQRNKTFCSLTCIDQE